MGILKKGMVFELSKPFCGHEVGARAVIVGFDLNGTFMNIIHKEKWLKSTYVSVTNELFGIYFIKSKNHKTRGLSGLVLKNTLEYPNGDFCFDIQFKNKILAHCEYMGTQAKFIVKDESFEGILNKVITPLLSDSESSETKKQAILDELAMYLHSTMHKGALSFAEFFSYKQNQFQY